MPISAPDPAIVALLQTQLSSINSRLAAGVRDVRYNNRSTTFDLKILQDERLRIEAELRTMGVGETPGASARPTVRRLFAVQMTKGL